MTADWSLFLTMGSFGRASWDVAIPACILMSIGVLVLLRKRSDIVQLGEAEAIHLGVDIVLVRKLVILGSAVAVGAGVALSGIVGSSASSYPTS